MTMRATINCTFAHFDYFKIVVIRSCSFEAIVFTIIKHYILLSSPRVGPIDFMGITITPEV